MSEYVFPGDSEKAHDDKPLPLPSFKTIAHMNAAFNVEIPNGATIALKAHQEVMKYFASICSIPDNGCLTQRNIMAAFLALRTASFWLALTYEGDRGSADALKELRTATESHVNTRMREQFPGSSMTFEEICSSVDSLDNFWPYVWSTLPDGWF